MHSTRRIILLSAVAVLALAATYYPGGLGRFYGDTTLTNLVTGGVYFNTESNTFWVGGVTSNPVKVGTIGVATTNDINTATAPLASTNYVHAQGFVTATITNSLADTNFVNSAVSNRAVTNAWNTLSLVITNSHPGTNAWLRSDDGTNLYWQASP